MIQMPKRMETIRNVLILAALVGLVLLSLLLGHILRYSIPALWHPPIQETDPQIRYGVEFEGIRRLIIFPGLALQTAPGPVLIREGWGAPPGECFGTTYYTSLPAKCQAADGRLVQAGGIESNVILILPGK
jgi:hypothetical protein